MKDSEVFAEIRTVLEGNLEGSRIAVRVHRDIATRAIVMRLILGEHQIVSYVPVILLELFLGDPRFLIRADATRMVKELLAASGAR